VRRHRKTVLSRARVDALRPHLEAVVARTDMDARLAADPVAFPRRYQDPRDREVAALYAGLLAFGRVDLFRPVLEAWFAWLDAGGGPHARTRDFTLEDTAPLRPLYYRWARWRDLVLVMRSVQETLHHEGSLQALFEGPGDVRARLTRATDTLRSRAAAAGPEVGLPEGGADDLPRGTRYLLASPRGGSACKRWNMILRWMVRPEDGVDLGLWTILDPSQLVVPVDTHVSRIARFVGLTRRPDTSWRTAEEITRNLRRFDPDDPVRFDFVLAHLGISGACLGHRHPQVCPACPLDPLCQAPDRRP
jgi:uncharacterized protein (TIGR02757 family)